MMKIYILGSCSGTEPRPGHNYTAWVLERDNGELFWFDIGGNCAATAYAMGLNPLRITHIFLSHPHLDHTAGLPELLQTISKEEWLHNDYTPREIVFHTPCAQPLAGAMLLFGAGQSASGVQFREKKLLAGTIYREENFQIETIPNRHMAPEKNSGDPLSFSFRIRYGTKNIVYTGDIKSLAEIAPWLEQCDLLMLETGHHRADRLCTELKSQNRKIGQLLFLHHGVEILADPAGEKAKADAAWEQPVLFAADRMVLVPGI